eukprot:1177351-Prorocentrum_minimum.AAC.2
MRELYDVKYAIRNNPDGSCGSLYLCPTRRPLSYFSHSELGPYGVSSDHPMYYVFVLANLDRDPTPAPYHPGKQ